MANPQIDADLVLRLKNLDKILNEIKTKVGAIQLPDFKFSAQAAQNYTQFIRVMAQSGPQFQAAATNINNFTRSIQASTVALNRAAPGLKAMASALNAVNNHSRTAKKTTADHVSVMEDLGRQTALTVRRFTGFLIARDLIFGLGYAFKNTISEAIKFEREITKIAQLQETSIGSARELGRFIGELAVKFGASSNELAQSAQVLAQAGKRTGEIKTILKALGEASLTPTFGDLTKTTDSLLAVLGQFNLQGRESAKVLDILNSVAKDFNVSVDELFEGVRRAGSTFSELSGVRNGLKPGIESLKEFVALFTSVIDTSRESAETVGTAFRTILPRLLRGETRDLLKKELGLDLLDDQQQFIGPFKAIEKLFNSLKQFQGTDVGLTKIVEELGGSRQFNRVLPLILEFPKAQRALEIANKSSGSVAKDTALAYQTLSVQLEQIKQQFLELGRDLVQSGTFKVFADSFITLAKAAAVLVKALEPVLPLLAGLATISAVRGGSQFITGAFRDNAFFMKPPVRKASGGNIDRVQSLLTPGELVLSPESARMNGQAALRRFNSTGDIGALKTLKGAQMVPGTGNSDSVPANLEPGSFVIRKSSVQKALGFKRFASGGRVGMATGGMTKDVSDSFLESLKKFDINIRMVSDKVKKLIPTDFNQLIKKAGIPFGMFANPAGTAISGLAGYNQGIVINKDRIGEDRGDVRSFARVFFHELTHYLGLDRGSNSTLPLAARRGAERYYVARRQSQGIGNIDPADARERESISTLFNLTGRLDTQKGEYNILKRLKGKTGDDLRGEFYGVTKELAEERALTGAPSRFQNMSEPLKKVFFRIQDSFIKEAEKIGASWDVIKYEFLTQARKSKDIVSLQSNLNARLKNVLAPTFQKGIPFEEAEAQNQASQIINRKGISSPEAQQLILDEKRKSVRNYYASHGLYSPTNVSPDNPYINSKPSTPLLSGIINRGRSGLSRLRGGLQSGSFSQGGYGATSAASLGAIVAGGSIGMGARTSGQAGLGGALSGAGIGAQVGLASGNPLIAAAGALAGALIGASNASNQFAKSVSRANLDKLVAEFVQGEGNNAAPLGRGILAQIQEQRSGSTFVNSLAGFIANPTGARNSFGSKSQEEAYSRLSFMDRLRFEGASPSARAGAVGRLQREEVESLRQANDPAVAILQDKIAEDARKGLSVRKIVEKYGSSGNLDVLSTANPQLQDTSELLDNKRRKQLGGDVLLDFAKQAAGANADLKKLQDTLARVTRSVISLNDSFNRIEYGLRKVDTAGENFDKRIQQILNPADVITPAKLNVFRNLKGVPVQDVQAEIGALRSQFNLRGPNVQQAANAAVVTSEILNELPLKIANDAGRNPNIQGRKYFTDIVDNAQITPAIKDKLTDSIDAFFQGDNGDKKLGQFTEKELAPLLSDLANGIEPSVEIWAKIHDQSMSILERSNAAIASQKIQLQGRVAEQGLNINSLNNRRQDLGREFLGLSTVSPSTQTRRVADDIEVLTGSRDTNPLSIGADIRALQEQGGSQEKIAQLTRALELLSTDTRVLDATIQKNNRLEEARQGARSISERILSGGNDEIAKINREVRDFQVLRGGGSLPTLQRTEAALRTGGQLTVGASEEQFERYGIGSRQDYLNNIENIRSVQTGGRVEAGTFRDILMENLRARNPTTDPIVNAGRNAIANQTQAALELQGLDQDKINKLSELNAEQIKQLGAGIQAAFESQPVQDFVTAAKTLSDGAILKLDGTVQVAVSFNNVDGAMKNIQEDLRGFVGRVVDEQIKKALNMPQVAKANTA